MGPEEVWASVDDFPGYQVSDYGRIYSERTGTMMSCSLNSTGSLKVNLMQDNQIQTRSVRVLVARAFVAGEDEFDNATPINLDGDPWNNETDNLLWRPRWFAWKYMRQFHEPIPPEYKVAVMDPVADITWPSTMVAGVSEGILWEYIYNSILTGRPVFPNGRVYIFA